MMPECHHAKPVGTRGLSPWSVVGVLASWTTHMTSPITAAATNGRAIATAFSQRRKMLRNTLREFFDEASLETLDVRATAHPEELSVAEYLRLANAL